MTTAIATRGLTRRFGDLTAVNNIDLDIPAGSVIGIVGPNGAGKSTTIRMLLGLIQPTEGGGTVFGESISHPERYAARVGALIENPAFLPNITARAVATATRSVTIAIAGGIGYMMVVEGLLGLVLEDATTYLPGSVLSAVVSGGTESLAYAAAVSLALVYAAVSLTVAGGIFMRRDITS